MYIKNNYSFHPNQMNEPLIINFGDLLLILDFVGIVLVVLRNYSSEAEMACLAIS